MLAWLFSIVCLVLLYAYAGIMVALIMRQAIPDLSRGNIVAIGLAWPATLYIIAVPRR